MEKIDHSERKRLLEELLHETKVFYFVFGFVCGIIILLLFMFIIM